MKIVQLLLLSVLLVSCKDKNAKQIIDSDQEEVKSIIKETPKLVQEINVPNADIWKLNNVNIKPTSKFFGGEEFYLVETIENDKSSFVSLDNISIPDVGGLYEISFLISVSNPGSNFGFRVQEFYPNRLDVVFNLKEQKVYGIEKVGDFIFEENAQIKMIDDSIYKCTITTEIYSEFIKFFFGPAIERPSIPFWEAKKNQQESVYIIPNSLKFNLVSY